MGAGTACSLWSGAEVHFPLGRRPTDREGCAQGVHVIRPSPWVPCDPGVVWHPADEVVTDPYRDWFSSYGFEPVGVPSCWVEHGVHWADWG